jgi:hypothetical protein
MVMFTAEKAAAGGHDAGGNTSTASTATAAKQQQAVPSTPIPSDAVFQKISNLIVHDRTR